MLAGHQDGVREAELEQLVTKVLLARVIRLVARHDHRDTRASQQVRDVPVDRRETLPDVEQEDDHLGFLDGDPGLGLHRRPGRIAQALGQDEAGGVDDRQLAPAPVGHAVEAVAGEARLSIDDGLPKAHQPVEESRFPGVRSPHQSEDGTAHSAHSYNPWVVLEDRVILKQNDIFVVSDLAGDVLAGNEDGFGLYWSDIRFLSTYELRVNGRKPILL